jgi:septal ring factor EnvC (AmiA/AmiB activator)
MRARLEEKEKDIVRWQGKAEEAKALWTRAAAALVESRAAIQAVRTKRQTVRRLADAALWASTENVLVARSAALQAGVLAQSLYGQNLVSPGSPRLTVEDAAPEIVYAQISQLSATSRDRSESAKQQEAALRGEELGWQNEEQKRSQEADRIHQKQEAQWLRWQEALRRKTAIEDEISQIDQSAKALQVMLQELRDHRDQTQALKGDSAANGRALANLRGTLPWPARGKVVESYGRHYSDDLNQLVVSNGIKIEAGAKHPVRVVLEGSVLFASPFRDYGRLVIIQHKNGLTSVYGGLGDVQVKPGQALSALDAIGLTADSGTFYFELRRDEQPINPLAYLTADKSSELSSRRTFR